MNRALVIAAIFAVLCWSAEAVLRVAIHEDSCNTASLDPAYDSRISIQKQLTVEGEMTATRVADANFNEQTLANYDVIYLGCGGKDIDLDSLSSSAAQAIYNFVNTRGGGLVMSATTATAFSEVRSILEPLMPTESGDMIWAKNLNQNSMPRITIKNTAHYITNHSVSSTVVTPLGFSFYIQKPIKSGWTSLADCETYTAQCCLSFTECGDNSYCESRKDQGILVKQVGKGRVAYINFAFCGYEMFGPHNLRRGNINQLFLNMFYWSSGLCKNVNECNNHGSCIGSGQCLCEAGWKGNDCGQVECPEGYCKNGGQCLTPTVCSCPEKYAPPDCSTCLYPYAGEGCNSHSKIQDPSFEENKGAWTFSDSNVVKGTTSGVEPYDGSKMLVFTGAAKTFTATQELYIMTSNGSPPFITIHYRGTSTTSKLQFLVDDDVLWEFSGNANSWTSASKSLFDYATVSGSLHTIKIKAIMSSASEVFYVDVVEDEIPVCSPDCVYGSCALLSSGSLGCICDEHHTGAICDAPLCGDGVIIYPETCDDGNAVSGDGCSKDCKVEDGWTCDVAGEPCVDICGDGRTMTSDPTYCDDGNSIDGDGCSSRCRVERGYKCVNSKTAKSVCSVWCGDGIVFGFEVCDDGNSNNNDGCSSDCSKVNAGWDCTSNYNQEDNMCIKEVCGDGRRTKSEQCDDGNTKDGDGCSSKCKIEKGWYRRDESGGLWPKSIMETRCGDGLTAGTEVCDGGFGCNSTDPGKCKPQYGYVCTVDKTTLESTCTIKCGDGIVIKSSEECDDGNEVDGDGCSSKCKIETDYHCKDSSCTVMEKNVCGDKKIHSPETCDIGTGNTSPGCVNCRLTPGWECSDHECHTVCGDGILTDDEFCDCGTPEKRNPFCDVKNGCENCKSINETMFSCRNLTLDGITYSSCRSLCGNGIRTENEACDDNNTNSLDGCSSTCQIEQGWNCDTPLNGLSVCTSICGDNLMVGKETCDEGGNTKGCINCVRQYGYVCDNKGHNCACKHGDGIICKEEQCDDGNENSQGCKDGKVVSGWECLNETGPTSVCIQIKCGNGQRTSDEECDDGNEIDGDGCSKNCKLEDKTKFQCDVSSDRTKKTVCRPRVCGDGVITDDEECDDGNTVSGDGCSSDCKVEKFYKCFNEPSSCHHFTECGDGFHWGVEECDDNNTIDGDGCSSNCTIEPGWVCKDVGYYFSECHVPVCGDGIREGTEECDDNNTIDGDGCSSTCRREAGFKCYESFGLSICKSYCGDGMKSANEECDDGNFVGGDGCSPTCKIEHGYTCFLNYTDPKCMQGACISLCFATCGDGIVAQEEECDDGNSYQGDGCYQCKLESEDWRCKGEPSECIQRKCTLPEPTAVVVNVLCNGASTGVIDVSVNTTEEYVCKLWKATENEPNSYQATSHFTNLVAGTYKVKVALVGFMECDRTIEVTITQPDPFKNFKVLDTTWQNFYNYPSSCSSSNGWIKWQPSGAVKPYKIYFANRTADDSIDYHDVNIYEFISGPPTVVDANNCSKTMEVPGSDYWPGPELCKEETVPYLKEGAIGLAAAFVFAIVAGISYSCWSSKRQVPKNWKGDQ